jgi:predicted dinucleotide-binding enzyme
MKIGVLGSGDVGRRLSGGFIELGHIVKIGSRDSTKEEVVQWVSNHGGEEGKASAGNFGELLHLEKYLLLQHHGMELPIL